MGRTADNWMEIVRSVPCPTCGAVKGAPCKNAYGRIFEGRVNYERRQAYYQLQAKRKAREPR